MLTARGRQVPCIHDERACCRRAGTVTQHVGSSRIRKDKTRMTPSKLTGSFSFGAPDRSRRSPNPYLAGHLLDSFPAQYSGVASGRRALDKSGQTRHNCGHEH